MFQQLEERLQRQHCASDAPRMILGTEPLLPGWSVSGQLKRDLFTSRGYVLAADALRHREQKFSRKKGADNTPPEVKVYEHSLFSDWQTAMSRAIHEGKNIIASAATSCGKTWVANLAVAYEVLSRDGCTALIVSPNSEVMRETVHDICTRHSKTYLHAMRMLDTMTRNYVTYDEKMGPAAQILVVSVESLVEFITSAVNADFVRKLRYIIFDEVHLPAVTNGLWWSQFIPHEAQLILLSATLGDPDQLRESLLEMQRLSPARSQEIEIISYNVRPIPLQPLLFKGCDMPKNGLKSAELNKAGRITCVVNQFDPTVRDVRALERSAVIPKTREEQYIQGQEVVARHLAEVQTILDKALEEAVLKPTVEDVYKAISYLFSNELDPVLCFHASSDATKKFAEGLISLITKLENEDPEWREAKRLMDRYEKEQFRARDDKESRKTDEKAVGRRVAPVGHNASARSKQRADTLSGGDWQKAMPESKGAKFDIHTTMTTINKWRFPSDLESIPTSSVPQWIVDCLERGIGVYVSSMPMWLRHTIFDAYKEGKLKLMIADPSISVGVNLPIRTVILCDEEGDITQTLYQQASGRAGRRGMDDQGYILHFMPAHRIRSYLTERVHPASLCVQNRLTHSELIRLMTPLNLDIHFTGLDYIDPPNRSGETRLPRVKFDDNIRPISDYKTGIMRQYYDHLPESEQGLCARQMNQIMKDQLHYHRLTKLIVNLPENSSILVVKLLLAGILHKFEPMEFIDLMSILFQRDEAAPESATDASGGDTESAYYVPEFTRFVGLLDTLQTYGDRYSLGINFKKPIRRYFLDFCKLSLFDPKYTKEIDAMGDWLYAMKRQVHDVAPGQGVGKRKQLTDRFGILLENVDKLYMAARRNTM